MEFAEQYDFLEIVSIFQEDNVSGMFTDGRVQFKDMMNAVRNRLIDVVIVAKLDRLARDLADAAETIKQFNGSDCCLIAR